MSGDFSSLWPPLGALLTFAYQKGEGLFNKYKDELDPAKDLVKWAKDYYDDIVPSQMERIRKDVQELYKEVEKWSKDVLTDINNTVHKGLDEGVIDPQTDGGLGETRDIFTPDGKVPMDVGTLPGMESDGGGMDRGGGASPTGSSPYDSPSPGSPSSGGGTRPTGAGSPGGSGTPPPTAGDVGAGPDDYVEYQPGEGQVVITHPDGSQTIQPWPP